MNICITGLTELKLLSLTLLLLLTCASADDTAAADDGCQSAGEYSFVCGPLAAEDLVLVPETGWIIASGMAPGAAIYLIDSEQKT